MLKHEVLNYVLCHCDVGSISPADKRSERQNLVKNYSSQVRRGLSIMNLTNYIFRGVFHECIWQLRTLLRFTLPR
jgi:hypothetical protein